MSDQTDTAREWAPSEAAREIGISAIWLRMLMKAGRVEYRWTRLGRVIPGSEVARLRAEREARLAGVA